MEKITLKNNTMKYKIFVAFDHYSGLELWQVIGMDNDYIGEYHTNLEDAALELHNLKNKIQ